MINKYKINLPDELATMRTKCWLPQKCSHEFVTIYLKYFEKFINKLAHLHMKKSVLMKIVNTYLMNASSHCSTSSIHIRWVFFFGSRAATNRWLHHGLCILWPFNINFNVQFATRFKINLKWLRNKTFTFNFILLNLII